MTTARDNTGQNIDKGYTSSPRVETKIPDPPPRESNSGCRVGRQEIYRALLIVLYIALLILQPFRHFTYVTTHSPTFPSLYLGHSSFCNPSVASPTSQFILQSFSHFSYVTSSSLNSPGEPPMQFTLQL